MDTVALKQLHVACAILSYVQAWLTAKVLALALYIGLGMIAFRAGRPRPPRITAWVGAQIVFIYIVLVALTRSPLPSAA